MPRVSVIVPAYNAEDHIADALESVARQTFDDWEVVVADDASTDATARIAGSYGPRVRVVRRELNGGVGAALDTAVRHSTGELLAVLASDDYWLPSYLEEMVGLYDSEQARLANVGIVACNARLLGPEAFMPGTYQDLVGFPGGATLSQLLRSNRIFGGALIPRRAVDEAGGFCVELTGTEDIDVWLRIVERGYRVVATRTPLVVYRIRPTSLTGDIALMASSKQTTYRRALARGNLSWSQRRLAHRGLRFQRALVENEGIVADRRDRGRLPYGRVVRALPLFALVVLEHPRRWGGLARLVREGRRPGQRRTGAEHP